jgi:hypothetical protein
MILIALHCTAPRARARAHKAASCDLIPTARIFLSNLITSHSPAPPVQSAEPGWIKVVQLAIGCESPIRAACTGAILEARARHAHTLLPRISPPGFQVDQSGSTETSQPHSTHIPRNTWYPQPGQPTKRSSQSPILPSPQPCMWSCPAQNTVQRMDHETLTHSLTHSPPTASSMSIRRW